MDAALVEELVGLPAAALDDLLRETELERRAAESKLAMIAAVVEQKQQFLIDGHRSMSAYLKAQINCSGAEANRIRRHARLLDRHPVAAAAVADGHISTANLDLLAKASAHPRAAEHLCEFMPTMVEHAEHFPVRDFGVLIDGSSPTRTKTASDPTTATSMPTSQRVRMASMFMPSEGPGCRRRR